MAFLQIFALVPVLWELLERIVKTVETEELPGSEKKQLALDALKSLVDVVGSIPGVKGKFSAEFVVNLAIPIIDIVVGIFNAIGIFRKKESA